MKSTIKVSISGIALNLEDDAYAALKSYLDKLEARFANRADGKEIVEDMEARIAELLLAHISSTDQPIDIAAVQEVLATMGKPDELAEGEEQKAANAATPASTVTRKRLYRDPDNQVVSGVCGGLGAYFNLDPIIFRLLFVVLMLGGWFFVHVSGGTILLVYLVLWIAIPRAKTMAQKLELRGESPTAANVERKLREEASGLNARSKPNTTVLSRLLKIFFIVIGVLIGIPIIAVGLGLIVALVALIVGGGWIIQGGLFSLFSFISTSGASPILLQVLLLLVLMIPIFLLIYAGLRLIFRFKVRSRRIIGASLVVWLLSILALGGMSAYAVKGYRSEARLSHSQTLDTKSDTLYLRMPAGFEDTHNRLVVGWGRDGEQSSIPLVWKDETEKKLTLFPEVSVEYVDNATSFSIKYMLTTRGSSRTKAKQKAEAMELMYELNDSLITLKPAEYSKHNKWSGEVASLIVYVPKSKTLVMDDEISYDESRTNGHNHWRMRINKHGVHGNWSDWDDWDD